MRQNQSVYAPFSINSRIPGTEGLTQADSLDDPAAEQVFDDLIDWLDGETDSHPLFGFGSPLDRTVGRGMVEGPPRPSRTILGAPRGQECRHGLVHGCWDCANPVMSVVKAQERHDWAVRAVQARIANYVPKTHCKRGHPLEGPEANVRVRKMRDGYSRRECRKCAIIRQKGRPRWEGEAEWNAKPEQREKARQRAARYRARMKEWAA